MITAPLFLLYIRNHLTHLALFPASFLWTQTSQSITSSKIITHPNYNDRTLNNDFALLVRLLTLNKSGYCDLPLWRWIWTGYRKDLVLVTNLGPWLWKHCNERRKLSYPTRLKHAQFSYVPPANTCGIMYRGRGVTSKMMYTVDTNEYSCKGDSGAWARSTSAKLFNKKFQQFSPICSSNQSHYRYIKLSNFLWCILNLGYLFQNL